MKEATKRQSVLHFLVAMSVVVMLGLGVIGTNIYISNSLFRVGLEQTVNANLSPVHLARAASAKSDPAEQSEAEGQFGLRLSSASNDLHDVSTDEDLTGHDASIAKTITAIFGTNSILIKDVVAFDANAPVDEKLAAIQQRLPKAEARFSARHVSPLATQQAYEGLIDARKPFVTIETDFSSSIKPFALISIPVLDAEGHNAGGLVYLTDQRSLLNRIGSVPFIGIIMIGVLCAASVLFAILIIWYRYKDVVKVNRDMEFLAHHDTLTGLPNRAVYNAKLNEGLRLAQAKASNMAAMLIDVDKFKEINDTYGHGTGDIFLQIIADRLRENFKDHLVSRLSGDEFAVMVTTYSDVARLTKLAADMIAATDQPCVIDGKEIKISLSIGIARASDGSWRASRLLHCADLALYKAKHSGRSTFVWYSPEMDADALKRKEIEADLVKALKFDQFKLLFQPQYSLVENQLKGYESLIRWEHPTKGSISPEVFIPVAEDTGLIQEIGDWVLNHACMEAARWPDRSLKVAVNVSPAQFMAGKTEVKVKKALEMSGLEPSRLEIEITESLLISNPDAVVETLQRIHDMGVSIAMDDFGTGYSSLSYLSRFSFDKIKIDRSFIQDLGEQPSLDAVVTAIIGLGHSLDVQITAEGVETEEQVILLRSAGCHLVQGFLFGKPGTVASHEAKRSQFQRSPITSDGKLKRYHSAEEIDDAAMEEEEVIYPQDHVGEPDMLPEPLRANA
ncbi:putative bifunctional diguanylate cyclase/phosphodiesterase [Roseibium sediminis]|uniref:putative bifunctional diguanylate cyclase/phosphodiesterase n=1 Tax=Roseibium sediminis TaxID=1775174 RepID=UPI001AD9262D|nr:GGDEF domain-containing phosphodiesterase [Roseibium sediminis]